MTEERKCNNCFNLFPLIDLFSYVDGNNGAITKNSLEYCKPCYKKRHNK